MILVRILLICIIVFLIAKSFADYGKEENTLKGGSDLGNKDAKIKKVSKKIGEYIEYEELDKK